MTTEILKRRQAITFIAVSCCGLSGCGSDALPAIEDISTETIESSRIGLRGFQLVAFQVGTRIVRLPHPAVRVLAVVLLTAGAATFLLVEYLDLELQKRQFKESLTDEERIAIESDQSVTFVTENEQHESVAIGPNRYEFD